MDKSCEDARLCGTNCLPLTDHSNSKNTKNSSKELDDKLCEKCNKPLSKDSFIDENCSLCKKCQHSNTFNEEEKENDIHSNNDNEIPNTSANTKEHGDVHIQKKDVEISCDLSNGDNGENSDEEFFRKDQDNMKPVTVDENRNVEENFIGHQSHPTSHGFIANINAKTQRVQSKWYNAQLMSLF